MGEQIPVPARAHEAARAAVIAWTERDPGPLSEASAMSTEEFLGAVAYKAVMAAAPHIRAAERERIAALAGEYGATYQTCPCGPGGHHPDGSPAPFADLIREEAE